MPDQTIQPATDAGVDLFKDLVFEIWKIAAGVTGVADMEDGPAAIATRYNRFNQYGLQTGAYVSKPIREKLIHEIFMTKEELEQGGFEQDL